MDCRGSFRRFCSANSHKPHKPMYWAKALFLGFNIAWFKNWNIVLKIEIRGFGTNRPKSETAENLFERSELGEEKSWHNASRTKNVSFADTDFVRSSKVGWHEPIRSWIKISRKIGTSPCHSPPSDILFLERYFHFWITRRCSPKRVVSPSTWVCEVFVNLRCKSAEKSHDNPYFRFFPL